MKIRFIRSDMEVQQNLIKEFNPDTMIRNEKSDRWYWRTDVDFEQKTAREVQLHVGMGNAEPVDDEAKRVAANYMTNWQQRLLRREALARCIAPEDVERFESGELLGYDDDQNDILSEGNDDSD